MSQLFIFYITQTFYKRPPVYKDHIFVDYLNGFPIPILEMNIWSESNPCIYFYIVLKKKWKKLTGPNKALLVLGRRTGAHREDYNTINLLQIFHLHIYKYVPRTEFSVTLQTWSPQTMKETIPTYHLVPKIELYSVVIKFIKH